MNNWVVGAEDKNVGTVFGEINDDDWTSYSCGLEVTKRDGSPEVLESW
jgi:hypothetical protein